MYFNQIRNNSITICIVCLQKQKFARCCCSPIIYGIKSIPKLANSWVIFANLLVTEIFYCKLFESFYEQSKSFPEKKLKKVYRNQNKWTPLLHNSFGQIKIFRKYNIHISIRHAYINLKNIYILHPYLYYWIHRITLTCFIYLFFLQYNIRRLFAALIFQWHWFVGLMLYKLQAILLQVCGLQKMCGLLYIHKRTYVCS